LHLTRKNDDISLDIKKNTDEDVFLEDDKFLENKNNNEIDKLIKEEKINA